jgi:hypothetical protein
MFEVVVFVACRQATPDGPRGPGASLRLPFTLEGVSYVYQFDDPAVEPPAAIGELWLYVRFFRRGGMASATRRFGLRVYAVNDDGTRTWVPCPAGARGRTPLDLGDVPFPGGQPVVNWTFRVPDLTIPRRGRFLLQLVVRRARPTWKGRRWRRAAGLFLLVE